jgi:hypothetical protein
VSQKDAGFSSHEMIHQNAPVAPKSSKISPMRADLKYLGIGLLIGLCSTSLFMVAVVFASGNPFTQPTVIPVAPTLTSVVQIFTETPTPSPEPTFTPTPTNIIFPTQTPITPSATLEAVEQMLANGQISISGPLTREQQIALYRSSLKFIAPSARESQQVGESINGKGYGSATLICGPLTLAIMQGGGLISNQTVVPYDFWLLNPYIEKDRALIERIFPAAQYEDTLFKTPINKFDWIAFPLKPGDFLFIRHGTGGNFDHIIVVNRVDSQMRAYAVTNYGTPDGFIINEVMLYDPEDASAGMFHTWTHEQNAILGSTGFGGFEIWRLRSQ